MALSGLQDPSYLAYQRALGLQEETARANAARQQSAISRQLQTAIPEIARVGVINRRRIGEAAESRGVFRSGGRLKAQAEQQAGEAYRVGQTYGSGVDRMGAIQGNLQLTLADLARQRADRASLYGVGV